MFQVVPVVVKQKAMEQPKLINNITERVVDDLRQRLSAQSRVSIAAASFSIYAYEVLKTELDKIDELRFIFTSPTFIKDKAKKKRGNSTFLNSIVSAISMAPTLRFVCATNFRRKPSPRNVPSG